MMFPPVKSQSLTTTRMILCEQGSLSAALAQTLRSGCEERRQRRLRIPGTVNAGELCGGSRQIAEGSAFLFQVRRRAIGDNN
jgi:hypothetical protein